MRRFFLKKKLVCLTVLRPLAFCAKRIEQKRSEAEDFSVCREAFSSLCDDFFSEKKLVLIEDEIRKTAGIEIKLEELNKIKKYLESDITISDHSYINLIKEPEFNSAKFEFLFK